MSLNKSLSILTLFLLFGGLNLWAVPAHADDAKPAAPSDAPKKDASSDSGEEGGGKSKGKTSSDVTGGRFAGDPVYVHLSPMVLPVISDSGLEQLVTIQVDIEVTDMDAADKLRINMPRVMDALMSALYGGLGQGSLRQGKLVNVTKVKAKATAAVEQVMGDNVKNVLIQGVSQRML